MEIPKTSREIVTERAGGRCERCGHATGAWGGHCHHRQGRSIGDHSPRNLVFLCPECHGHVHAHPAESRDTGFIVSRYAEAGEVPVDHFSWGRCLLLGDGGWVPAE